MLRYLCSCTNGRNFSTQVSSHDIYREKLRQYVDHDPIFREFVQKRLNGSRVTENTEKILYRASLLQMIGRTFLTAGLGTLTSSMLLILPDLLLSNALYNQPGEMPAIIGIIGATAVATGWSIPTTSRSVMIWRRLREIRSGIDRDQPIQF